ncbi:MAG: recombination protein RecR [Bacteroidales bacterium]|nr:recombination protein RecR [Bacteroidales bacterium]MBN2764512.1 recombination protein RecR [Bacteroidales bacterium]
MELNYHSKLLEAAVTEFARLPGIGRKTALRLALHLLKQEKEDAEALGNAIIRLCDEVKQCKICMNISDNDICNICSDRSRDHSIICVVESIKDILVIENTQQFKGVYHVLGGIISPMDGIGPGDLTINALEERIKQGGIKELILALSATMEGDTTNYYLYRKLHNESLVITTLARGVSVGDELEYTDEITLGRSIVNRIPFEVKGDK